jgi:hypothetical protein
MSKQNSARAKVQSEVDRLERELFRDLPRMFEPEIVTRKAEIEALRKSIGYRPPSRRKSKPKPGPGQGVLFK